MMMNARWDAIRAARAKSKADGDHPPISPTAMVAWCVVSAMRRHERFATTLDIDAQSDLPDRFDLGISVALNEDGLKTAVLKDMRNTSWPDFIAKFTEAVSSTREGDTEPRSHLPVTISTLGNFDVHIAIPIVVAPSIATIYVGSAQWEPDPATNGTTNREVVTLCLTFDHRWINGIGAAAFLSDIKNGVEAFRLPPNDAQ